MAKLGELIRTHRKRYGMSQAELSRRIHMSQTALNQLELGQTHDPRFSVVTKIAAVLGLSLDALAFEQVDTTSKEKIEHE